MKRQFFDQRLEQYTRWRHDLHAHPEIAFEEERTAAFVAQKLKEFGLEVTTGLAKTGVVGVLKAQQELHKRGQKYRGETWYLRIQLMVVLRRLVQVSSLVHGAILQTQIDLARKAP